MSSASYVGNGIYRSIDLREWISLDLKDPIVEEDSKYIAAILYLVDFF